MAEIQREGTRLWNYLGNTTHLTGTVVCCDKETGKLTIVGRVQIDPSTRDRRITFYDGRPPLTINGRR